jgi:GNAT superfamily N-acetyltransferase
LGILFKKGNKTFMPITLHPATPEDFPAMLELIKGLAEFQGTPEKVTSTVAQMQQDARYFEAWLAKENDMLVGMATYSYVYYSWVGKSIYLDDLYVKSEYRGQKIGKLLLEQLLKTAKEVQCKRVQWQVSEWNTGAIEVYKKLGATLHTGYYICDINV